MNELIVLMVVLALVWVGYRAVFRWLDVREQLRVWGPGPAPKRLRRTARH